MPVTEWLLDADPAIRWQVMRDITGESSEAVAAERARVATEGWGAQLLALQDAEGSWGRDALPQSVLDSDDLPDPSTRELIRTLHNISHAQLGGWLELNPDDLAAWESIEVIPRDGGPAKGKAAVTWLKAAAGAILLDLDPSEVAAMESEPLDEGFAKYASAVMWMKNAIGSLRPEWTSTTWSLDLVRLLGLDPASEQARHAVALVRENVTWENDGQAYFDGEVEECINGRTVAIGAYFGERVDGIVERLLGERLDDGGWNCETERGSTRSSFHSTLQVLEGLLEYERAKGPSAEVTEARLGAHEYLLERRLLRRLSTGEIVNPAWTQFSFPTRWRYDALRALDYLRSAGVEPDERCAEAIEIVAAKRDVDGRWPLENTHPGMVHFEMDDGDGKPSRWNTLRALRVLDWYERS